jgi:hypothetical protein
MNEFHINVIKNAPSSEKANTTSVNYQEAFKQTILEFVWDNWFSLEEQKSLRIPSMLNGQAFREGQRTVLRFYNPSTDTIQYEMDGAKASEAIRKVVQAKEEKDKDMFRSKEEGNPFLTGSPYGFLIGKKGLLAFKTNSVPPKGVKWDKGRECGNDTKSDPKYIQLSALGTQLRNLGLPDLGLQKFVDDRSLATECCIMMELAMRYMDIMRISGKRWFYRPVIARILGHLGAANEQEEVPTTKATKATTTTAATTAATATAAAPKSVVPKKKQQQPVVVTKLPEGLSTVNEVSARLTIGDMKKLSKRELQTLTNDDLPEDITPAEYLRIFTAAPEEPPLNKTIEALFSTKAPSQTVNVTKKNEEVSEEVSEEEKERLLSELD